MTSRVVHINDHVEGAVYIGRAMPRQGLKASPFANPYRIGGAVSRDYAMTLYEQHLTTTPHLWALIPELRGKPLACWCRHDGEAPSADTRCHGDVLVGLLAAFSDEQFRERAMP